MKKYSKIIETNRNIDIHGTELVSITNHSVKRKINMSSNSLLSKYNEHKNKKVNESYYLSEYNKRLTNNDMFNAIIADLSYAAVNNNSTFQLPEFRLLESIDNYMKKYPQFKEKLKRLIVLHAEEDCVLRNG